MNAAQKHITSRCFSNAAHEYSRHARVQKRAAHLLLKNIPRKFGVCLDLGSGPGVNVAALTERFDQVLALDLSIEMLKKGGAERALCADMDALPLCADSLDGVFSNFAIQWSSEPAKLIKVLYQCLKPGATAYLSCVCEGSLKEIETAWQAVDSDIHINRFNKPDDLLGWSRNAGFSDIKLDSKRLIDVFGTPLAAIKSIKAIGANHAMQGRRRQGLLGRGALHALLANYPLEQEGYCVTYQVCFLELTK